MDRNGWMQVLPVALASAVLLCLLGINVGEAVLRKVLGEMVLGEGSTVSQSGVRSVVSLVGASH